MKRRKAEQFTPVELEIMKVLWQTAPATVQIVRKNLPTQPRPAYTTVQTMLNVLLRKGKVKRVLKGQAYQYVPIVSKKAAAGQAVRDLLNRLFGGSSEDLVMNLIQDRRLTPEKLTQLAKTIEQSRSRKEKSDVGD